LINVGFSFTSNSVKPNNNRSIQSALEFVGMVGRGLFSYKQNSHVFNALKPKESLEIFTNDGPKLIRLKSNAITVSELR
jgi:hypothetical protein